MRLAPGELVGPFRLERLLGKGGMGSVFAARHQTGAEVAVKVLEVEDPEEGPKLLERFKREISAMVRIGRHPNLVRVHTAGTHGTWPYVVMELVPGRDLSKKIDKRPMDPALAARIVEKVARAVHHCHEQGVIHRDLKPANVLLRDDGEPVVTDFGLAREDTAERMTRTGELLGTPSYMAPEQVEGQRDAQDRRTDVYALGAILYECLTGEPPFGADSKAALVKQILLEDPVSVRKKVPAAPEDLDVIAAKCLEKERSNRYQTALELACDLARFLKGEPIVARPLSSAEKRQRWIKRHGRELVLGTVGATLLLFGAVVFGGLALHTYLRGEKIARTDRAVLDVARIASSEGFPRLPRAISPALEEAVRPLRAARGDLGLEGRLLVRWADLTQDPRRALAGKDALDDPRAQALDAVAALRLREAPLLASVKARAKGAELEILEAREPPRLKRLVEAYDHLGEDEKAVWADAFVDDCARAFERVFAGEEEPAPESARLLKALLAAPASPIAALPARLAAVKGWEKLGERVDLAVTFGRLAGGDAARSIGNRLAKTARERFRKIVGQKTTTGIESVIDDDSRQKIFELYIGATNLGVDLDPVEDLEPLFRTSSLYPDKLSARERVYRFALYLESGFTPLGVDLTLRGQRPPEEKHKHADAVRQAASVLAKDVPTTACALTFALVLLENGFVFDLPDAGAPTEERDAWLRPALEELAKIRPALTDNLLAVERFEYADLMLRLRNPLAGFRDGLSPTDPGVLAAATKALDEASGHHFPVELMEVREDVAFRWVWRAFDQRDVAAIDSAAKGALAAIDAWGKAQVEFAAAGAELSGLEESKMTPQQRKRRFELSLCYSGKHLYTVPLNEEVDLGLRRFKILHDVATVHAFKGDEAGARESDLAALKEMDRLLALDPDAGAKAAEVHRDRALTLISLGRPEEALAAADRSLKYMDGDWDQVKGDLTRAKALKALGRVDEARIAAEKSAKLAHRVAKGPVEYAESDEFLETLK